MSDTTSRPLFYTVREAAKVLRVDANTIYREIRENAFPAVKIRTRYIVPAKAIEALASGATETGGVLDVAAMVQQRQVERELAQRWR
ncbi:DNA-binding protein [Saccharothrix sp. ALI-22-I]|uniref:helix-turn-helix domain-containing protein n=1 Tax=Saccharothrix sp. ALI-22-I TaxID=1933778 RepID=UPI00097CA8ED|nr:helix-turn-helix domain-containing protein [Saccharothrix sp. ALI-22-I]ONI89991.1 DNA-binding protein [Saccharothrix sp. ALI-22-I]